VKAEVVINISRGEKALEVLAGFEAEIGLIFSKGRTSALQFKMNCLSQARIRVRKTINFKGNSFQKS